MVSALWWIFLSITGNCIRYLCTLNRYPLVLIGKNFVLRVPGKLVGGFNPMEKYARQNGNLAQGSG